MFNAHKVVVLIFGWYMNNINMPTVLFNEFKADTDLCWCVQQISILNIFYKEVSPLALSWPWVLKLVPLAA